MSNTMYFEVLKRVFVLQLNIQHIKCHCADRCYAFTTYRRGINIYLVKQHYQSPALQQEAHYQPWLQVLVDGEAQLPYAYLVKAIV